MRRKLQGMSLIETILSVMIFSILMMIIFGTLKYFTGVWKKEDARQDVNRQFTKVYKVMNKDISVSSLKHVVLFSEVGSLDNPAIKWIAFPSATDENGVFHFTHDGNGDWIKTIVYLLIRDGSCSCSSYKTCPHKKLLRKELDMVFDSDNYTAGQVYDGIRGFLKEDIRQSSKQILNSKTVEENIYDIHFTKDNTGIETRVDVLRIQEAGQHLAIGEEDLSAILNSENSDKKKYMSSLIWFVFIKNH